MNDERMIEIETKIAYQEHIISDLNEVVCQQQAIIDDLKKKVDVLFERIINIGDMVSTRYPENEKPPHY